MQKLPYRYAIYVPSKDTRRKHINHRFAKEDALAFLCAATGGATCLAARGIWENGKDNFVVEFVTIVYAYSATNIDHSITKFAKEARIMWNQESVAIETPDGLILVND